MPIIGRGIIGPPIGLPIDMGPGPIGRGGPIALGGPGNQINIQ